MRADHDFENISGFAVKLSSVILVFCALVATLSCGSGSPPANTSAPLSGNWEITLVRHNSATQYPYSGFLVQSGSSVTGSVLLNGGNGCAGVGTVTGTVNGQAFQLDINEFGQDISLTGTIPQSGSSGSESLSGQFSSVTGGCLGFTSTGNWSAVRVAPLAGAFHGTFVAQNGTTTTVTGAMTEAANTGNSFATVSGSIAASGSTPFCPYLTTATISGLVSGTNVELNLYGPDGSQIGEIPSGVPVTLPEVPPLLTANATSITGTYTFLATSPSSSSPCQQISGTVALTFP